MQTYFLSTDENKNAYMFGYLCEGGDSYDAGPFILNTSGVEVTELGKTKFDLDFSIGTSGDVHIEIGRDYFSFFGQPEGDIHFHVKCETDLRLPDGRILSGILYQRKQLSVIR